MPRICHLRVTKIEALTQLTSSKSEIKIVVVMNDGRSRLRDGVRAARLKRAALSSAPMPVQMSSTCSIAVNINFFMQYFHNLRTPTDSFRILLQKKSKHHLVNKVIAECNVSLADVLQGPLDEGSHLMLHSTGRLKHSQQAGAINAPLIRLHCQLESLDLDRSDVTRWWPSDKGYDIDDSQTPNLDGIFSGEDIEEEDDEDNDWPDRLDEDDEWVETHQILSASSNARGVNVVLGLPSALQGDEQVMMGMAADARRNTNFRAKVLKGTLKVADVLQGAELSDVEGDDTGANAAGARPGGRSNNFRAKVLRGTLKIANMTLHPMRAVKNGYARIRRRKNKGEGRGVSGPEGDDLDENDYLSPFGDDQDDDEAEDSLQWVAWDDGEDDENEREEEDEAHTPTIMPSQDIETQVTQILRQSAHELQGPLVILVNTASRRGALLQDLMMVDDEHARWSEDVPLRASLRTIMVAAPGFKDIRAALRAVLAYRQDLDRLDERYALCLVRFNTRFKRSF